MKLEKRLKQVHKANNDLTEPKSPTPTLLVAHFYFDRDYPEVYLGF
jgi:hypothetical protein